MGEADEWGLQPHEIGPPVTIREYFEAFRDRGKRGVWITAAGEKIPVEELEDSHLLNIARMLRGYGAQDFPRRGIIAEVWLSTIDDEIDRRGLSPREAHASSYIGGPTRKGLAPRDSRR